MSDTLHFLVRLDRKQEHRPVVKEVARYDLLSQLHQKVTPEELKGARRLAGGWRKEYEEPLIEPIVEERRPTVLRSWRSPLADTPCIRPENPRPSPPIGQYLVDDFDKVFVKKSTEQYGVLMTTDYIEKAFLHYELALLYVERYLERKFTEDQLQCNICGSKVEEKSNRILYCSICEVPVHQACYGIEKRPKEDNFTCDVCRLGNYEDCRFCGRTSGAMKRDEKLQFNYHVSCALWLREVRFYDWTRMKDIYLVKPNWKRYMCVQCKTVAGLTIQCKQKTCTARYHVACAKEAGYRMDYVSQDDRVELNSYCAKHGGSRKVYAPGTFLQFMMYTYVPDVPVCWHYMLAKYWLTKKIHFPFIMIHWSDKAWGIRHTRRDQENIPIELEFVCPISVKDNPVFTGPLIAPNPSGFTNYCRVVNTKLSRKEVAELCAIGDCVLSEPDNPDSWVAPVGAFFELYSFMMRDIETDLREESTGMDDDGCTRCADTLSSTGAVRKRGPNKGADELVVEKVEVLEETVLVKSAKARRGKKYRQIQQKHQSYTLGAPSEKGDEKSLVGTGVAELESAIPLEELPSTSGGRSDILGLSVQVTDMALVERSVKKGAGPPALRRSERIVALQWKAHSQGNRIACCAVATASVRNKGAKRRKVLPFVERAAIMPPPYMSIEGKRRVFLFFPLFKATFEPTSFTIPLDFWLMVNEKDMPPGRFLTRLKDLKAGKKGRRALAMAKAYAVAKMASTGRRKRPDWRLRNYTERSGTSSDLDEPAALPAPNGRRAIVKRRSGRKRTESL